MHRHRRSTRSTSEYQVVNGGDKRHFPAAVARLLLQFRTTHKLHSYREIAVTRSLNTGSTEPRIANKVVTAKAASETILSMRPPSIRPLTWFVPPAALFMRQLRRVQTVVLCDAARGRHTRRRTNSTQATSSRRLRLTLHLLSYRLRLHRRPFSCKCRLHQGEGTGDRSAAFATAATVSVWGASHDGDLRRSSLNHHIRLMLRATRSTADTAAGCIDDWRSNNKVVVIHSSTRSSSQHP